MKEAELNTIISKSLNRYEKGWGFKIPDPSYGEGTQRCFDGFGAFNRKPLYFETKLIKGVYSFNLNRIEEHQWKHLCNLKAYLPNALCLVPVGFYIPRKTTYILWFNIETLVDLTFKEKGSILKKELETYIQNGLYLEVKTEKINDKRVKYVQNIDRLEEVII